MRIAANSLTSTAAARRDRWKPLPRRTAAADRTTQRLNASCETKSASTSPRRDFTAAGVERIAENDSAPRARLRKSY
ncbi:hypothetical protein MPC1_3980001 [Methylocella tundrae]|nr:hypothetical protein MPC1_3980001 [Methylocella tundrae]